jgi:predicted nucleic acid-binding protein
MGKTFLIDTNVLIYYFDNLIPADSEQMVDNIFINSFNISIISKIEFLGWHKFSEEQYEKAVNFLRGATIFSLAEATVDKTIQIKRQRRIKLPDGVIAATCLINDLTLVTRNTDDFKYIEGLDLYNPFQSSPK